MDIEVQKNIIIKHLKRNNMVRTKDLIDQMMDYECGILSDPDTLEMFSTIVKQKMQYSLQGHYGRTATALIQDGWIDQQGNILKELE